MISSSRFWSAVLWGGAAGLRVVPSFPPYPSHRTTEPPVPANHVHAYARAVKYARRRAAISDEGALHAAIHASEAPPPNANLAARLPSLVYADYLEERGRQALADTIRFHERSGRERFGDQHFANPTRVNPTGRSRHALSFKPYQKTGYVHVYVPTVDRPGFADHSPYVYFHVAVPSQAEKGKSLRYGGFTEDFDEASRLIGGLVREGYPVFAGHEPAVAHLAARHPEHFDDLAAKYPQQFAPYLPTRESHE